MEHRGTMRNRRWFEGDDLNGIIHRGWTRAQGFSPVVFDGRPVIGIVNSWSEVANCHADLRALAEAVKRGVWGRVACPWSFQPCRRTSRS